MTTKQRGRIMALCADVGLGPDERHELAEYVIGRPSLSGASQLEAGRLIDALTGHVAISQLLTMRPPGCEPGLPKPPGRPVYATEPNGTRWLVAYR